jgi:hypothetical protein
MWPKSCAQEEESAMAIYDETERQIVKRLKSLRLRGDYSDGNWTRQIKISIGTLGTKLGYSVCAGGPFQKYDFESGWLYDLVWYKENAFGLIDVPLVLESEWKTYAQIKYDFEKLLVARAKYRVMIFQATPANTESILSRLKQIIGHSEMKARGDRYLFAVVDPSGDVKDEHYVVGSGKRQSR